jgi:hypothetical protein
VANATYATSAGSATTATSATTAGTVTTAAQGNITSVGTLTSLAVTGNIAGGNLSVSGAVYAGSATVDPSSVAGFAAGQINESTTGFAAPGLVIGSSTGQHGAIVYGGNTMYFGTENGTDNTMNTRMTLNPGGVLSVTGNITTTANIAGGNINNTNANGVGNIGSATTYFNTVFAKATSAQYADLAEMYVADQTYAPGTVVEFGGLEEITQSTSSYSTAIAGVISTNPSYIMNAGQQGTHVLPVAFTGRVPCQVQGPVNKGDVLVSSNIPGTAQRIGAPWMPGCVIGKSLGIIADSSVQTIEVVVGRF